MFLKISVEIEMVARPADQIGPDVQVKLPPMGSEDFLPSQELRTFTIDDDAVEIEDQRFNHR